MTDTGPARHALDPAALDAVIFDVDGVVTDTAAVHAAAWKALFDEFLRAQAEREGTDFVPFDIEHDYLEYVDGLPRLDGIRTFLASRGLALPDGGDGPETVVGLGDRKNGLFRQRLQEDGVTAYASSVALIRALRAAGVATAAVSSSRNAGAVLAAAGLTHLFDAQVDGNDADALGLPGKPDPALFLEAARRLGVEPARAAVVEDALAGVQAGARGGFALVVGVDRAHHADELTAAGADIVVRDVGELTHATSGRRRPAAALPSALDADLLDRELGDRQPAVFLDYDGTLTPIVERPQDALLAEETRAVIRRLADLTTVAIVSGRDLADVRDMVAVDGLVYAGSHGFDIEAPGGLQAGHGAEEYLPALDAAEAELRERLAGIQGVNVERKRFAVAVHFRQVADADLERVAAGVEEVARARPELRRTGGKKIYELRPGLPWDKGKAVLFLFDALGLDPARVVPLYVGDDETDEDAFAALAERGIGFGVVVGDPDFETSARYRLPAPEDVAAFLQLLIDRLERTAP